MAGIRRTAGDEQMARENWKNQTKIVQAFYSEDGSECSLVEEEEYCKEEESAGEEESCEKQRPVGKKYSVKRKNLTMRKTTLRRRSSAQRRNLARTMNSMMKKQKITSLRRRKKQ